jgi:rifampicin phosphotransferase
VRLIEEGTGRVATASDDELIQLVDGVGSVAGVYLFSLAVVGGSPWKMEACPARFCRKHLPGLLRDHVQGDPVVAASETRMLLLQAAPLLFVRGRSS